MRKHREKSNWSGYNQKLKKIARIDFFISEEAIENWSYSGRRYRGGKKLYSDFAIELCLLMREFYKLPYRQTQGFVESIFQLTSLELSIPDYTTMSRRASNLKLSLRNENLLKKDRASIVVAVDSTGLSLYTHTEWNRMKHKRSNLESYERWRKLHVVIDVATGEILENKYTRSTCNDGPELPSMLDSIEEDISAVCGDMAYDTVNCRRAIRMLVSLSLQQGMQEFLITTGTSENIMRYYMKGMKL